MKRFRYISLLTVIVASFFVLSGCTSRPSVSQLNSKIPEKVNSLHYSYDIKVAKVGDSSESATQHMETIIREKPKLIKSYSKDDNSRAIWADSTNMYLKQDKTWYSFPTSAYSALIKSMSFPVYRRDNMFPKEVANKMKLKENSNSYVLTRKLNKKNDPHDLNVLLNSVATEASLNIDRDNLSKDANSLAENGIHVKSAEIKEDFSKSGQLTSTSYKLKGKRNVDGEGVNFTFTITKDHFNQYSNFKIPQSIINNAQRPTSSLLDQMDKLNESIGDVLSDNDN